MTALNNRPWEEATGEQAARVLHAAHERDDWARSMGTRTDLAARVALVLAGLSPEEAAELRWRYIDWRPNAEPIAIWALRQRRWIYGSAHLRKLLSDHRVAARSHDRYRTTGKVFGGRGAFVSTAEVELLAAAATSTAAPMSQVQVAGPVILAVSLDGPAAQAWSVYVRSVIKASPRGANIMVAAVARGALLSHLEREGYELNGASERAPKRRRARRAKDAG